MDIEDAIERLEGRYMNVSMCGTSEEARAQNEAINMAITALRAQQEAERNKPLTIDELKNLSWEWIWIEILDPNYYGDQWVETKSAYYKSHYQSGGDSFWCGYPGIGFSFKYSNYGEKWLAYRRPPKEAT